MQDWRAILRSWTISTTPSGSPPWSSAAMVIRRAVVPRAVVPRAVIAHAPNLKVIAMHGVSRDTIDTAAAAEFGVPVPNVPDRRAHV